MRHKVKTFLSIYFVASVAFGLFALILAFPFHPISALGWAIWFIAALPIAVVGEAIGSAIFGRRLAKAISDDTQHVSGGRIAYGVFAALLFLTVAFLVIWLLDAGWGDFWDTHFSSNW